jgi:hypothetical protein
MPGGRALCRFVCALSQSGPTQAFRRVRNNGVQMTQPGDVREQVDNYVRESRYNFVRELNPGIKIEESSGRWWVQHGPDMQSGVAGFGKTLEEALRSFEEHCAREPRGSSRLTPARS